MNSLSEVSISNYLYIYRIEDFAILHVLNYIPVEYSYGMFVLI